MENFPDLEEFLVCNAQPFTPAEERAEFIRPRDLGKRSSYVFSSASTGSFVSSFASARDAHERDLKREETQGAQRELDLDSQGRRLLPLEKILASLL